MSWIFFTLLNIFGNGTALFITKHAVKDKKLGYSGVMFVSLFFAILCYLPVFIYSFSFSPTIFSQLVGVYYLLIAMSITITAFFLYVHALALNDLSVFGPLDNIRPLFVIIFSYFLLGQQPTSLLLVGVAFIITGALVLTLKKQFFQQVSHLHKTFFILASTAAFGLTGVFDKKALHYMDPFKYTFFILLGVCTAYGVLYFRRHKRVYIDHFLSWKLILSGLLWAVGYIGIMTAVKLSTPNNVTPLQMSRSLYLSFLGFLFLGEKGYKRKIIAAILMLIGVFFITR